MDGSPSPPSPVDDKRLVNTYDYTLDPTDAHISQFVGTTAANRRQVARFQVHNNQTTTGVVDGYAAKGVKATSGDLRYQKNLLYLRNTWPQGRWHPDNYIANPDNPSRDLNNSQESPGWLVQAIRASTSQVFGAKIPGQALKLLRAHHQEGNEKKPKRAANAPELARADVKAESDVAPPASLVEQDLAPAPAPAPLSLTEEDCGVFFFPVEEEEAAAQPWPQISHSPPPRLPNGNGNGNDSDSDGNESECSIDGVISHMLSRPGMPMAPATSKHRAIVAEAEARQRQREAQKAKRKERAAARKKAAAAVDKNKVASIYAKEAAKSARKVGRERLAGLLSEAKRDEIERDMAVTVKKRVRQIL